MGLRVLKLLKNLVGRVGYGPLMKSPAEDLPEDPQQDQSVAKDEDS